MSNSKITKNTFPQLPCALAEFVPSLLSKSVRLNLKIDPPSETLDP
jgi:hypothetical protein